jgi:hypothetical protein
VLVECDPGTIPKFPTYQQSRRVGHHTIDVRSVLGTVQGSPLRSDRACARPSGLDGACAQMIRGQLRDGRLMLFRPEQAAHQSIHRTALSSARECSIVSGRARFIRLLRFIFRDFAR